MPYFSVCGDARRQLELKRFLPNGWLTLTLKAALPNVQNGDSITVHQRKSTWAWTEFLRPEEIEGHGHRRHEASVFLDITRKADGTH
jgi:hypothetical protein